MLLYFGLLLLTNNFGADYEIPRFNFELPPLLRLLALVSSNICFSHRPRTQSDVTEKMAATASMLAAEDTVKKYII